MVVPNVNDQDNTHDTSIEDDVVLTDDAENESSTGDLSVDDDLSINLNEVPAELKPVLEKYHKQMKATFTKKTQAIAEQRKGLEKIGYKAEVLDRLMEDPRVVNYLASLQGDEGGSISDDNSESDPDPKQLISQAVQPLYNELQRMSIEAERDRFIKDYPDWEQHLDSMNQAWAKQPGLTFEGAYLQAVGAKYIKAKAKADKTKKIPPVEKPGPSSNAKSDTPIKNFDDAVKAAFAELGVDSRRIYDE